MIYAYARVSTNHQVGGSGIPAQLDAVRVYCDSQGWQLEEENIFIDEGVSGATEPSQRPALGALIQRVKRGDTIVVYSLSRVSRDLLKAMILESEFERKGVSIVSTKGEGTGVEQDATSVLLKRVVQVFSEFERNQARARTSAALQSRKERLLVWGHVPYGFKNDGIGGVIVNEEEAGLMKAVDRFREMGLSYRAILDVLNKRQYLSRKRKPWTIGNLYVTYKGWNQEGRERYALLSAG